MKGFSVIMPSYNHASFIRRAIASLFNQTYRQWELIIINDGCTDHTESVIWDYMVDERVKYIKNNENCGLGFALNQGLDHARYDHIAYLPSDDFYYEDHLQTFADTFDSHPGAILAASGIRYDHPDSMYRIRQYQSSHTISDHCLQLVQTSHRLTGDRWMTRTEGVTENLFTMFWYKLTGSGTFMFTGKVTCNWTSHPEQRHKIISETYNGGLNYYRRFYQVKEPVKFRSGGKNINEQALYAPFRGKQHVKRDGLKILLVGELAYNPERVHTLEKAGHSLFGLWLDHPPHGFQTVGHLPFGNVVDIPYHNWMEAIRTIKPDIIYAMLNTSAVPLAHEVLKNKGNIPMVWHFKEGPFYCLRLGTWNKLIDLYSFAEGKIYLNPEIKEWYEQFIPTTGPSMILDGDLPNAHYFTDQFSERISGNSDDIHTVVPGRIIGIETTDIEAMAQNHIHLHIYTDIDYHVAAYPLFEQFGRIAPNHVHFHPSCTQADWVGELSKYDAGWLHCFKSENNGNLMRATWDDLNLPARINTLAAAGLPMIQYDNSQHIVAMQSHMKNIDGGIFFTDINNLAGQLNDQRRMQETRNNVISNRPIFTFDFHLPTLVEFFHKVIEHHKDK